MTLKQAEIFYKQAMAYLDQGKIKESVKFFDSALKIDESYVSAWNDKGIALMELKKYKNALKCFEQVIRLDPSDDMAWYNRGYVLLILEEYQESVNSLSLFLARHASKDDFHKYALYMKAKGLYLLKEYDESLNTIQKAIKLDKTFKEAYELKKLIDDEKSK